MTKENIPIALTGTILVAALFLGASMYAQVLGFGPANISQLTDNDSPLSTLATRFLSWEFALLIDRAVMSSAFSCTMGTVTAVSRMLVVLSWERKGGWFGSVDRTHCSPCKALLAISLCNLAGTVIWGSRVGGVTYTSACASIGGLALILVYALQRASCVNFGPQQFPSPGQRDGCPLASLAIIQ
jgi:amino acid transporter